MDIVLRAPSLSHQSSSLQSVLNAGQFWNQKELLVEVLLKYHDQEKYTIWNSLIS